MRGKKKDAAGGRVRMHEGRADHRRQAVAHGNRAPFGRPVAMSVGSRIIGVRTRNIMNMIVAAMRMPRLRMAGAERGRRDQQGGYQAQDRFDCKHTRVLK